MSAPAIVAIDGPSASGKSTVARRVASELGSLYVDSGALYRAVTWRVLRDGLAPDDPAQVIPCMAGADMNFFVDAGAVKFRVDGVEPGEALRTETINRGVSPVAATPAVRRQVVAWLRGLVEFGPLVMEGRDIGTAVFPDAPHKFYLDASAEERARRRHAEMDHGTEKMSLSAVGSSLQRRDKIDSSRKMDPLRTAADAVIVDSTSMSIAEVVAFIVARTTA